jgi:hypothetical protein
MSVSISEWNGISVSGSECKCSRLSSRVACAASSAGWQISSGQRRLGVERRGVERSCMQIVGRACKNGHGAGARIASRSPHSARCFDLVYAPRRERSSYKQRAAQTPIAWPACGSGGCGSHQARPPAGQAAATPGRSRPLPGHWPGAEAAARPRPLPGQAAVRPLPLSGQATGHCQAATAVRPDLCQAAAAAGQGRFN